MTARSRDFLSCGIIFAVALISEFIIRANQEESLGFTMFSFVVALGYFTIMGIFLIWLYVKSREDKMLLWIGLGCLSLWEIVRQLIKPSLYVLAIHFAYMPGNALDAIIDALFLSYYLANRLSGNNQVIGLFALVAYYWIIYRVLTRINLYSQRMGVRHLGFFLLFCILLLQLAIAVFMKVRNGWEIPI